MLVALVFLTPTAGLVALGAALPAAGIAVGARRVRAVRALLGLEAPPVSRGLPRIVLVSAVPALLGLAATQPALRSVTTVRARTDAQAFFVIDISRSMAASNGPGGTTRLARAVDDAIALRAAIPTVPSGLATMTDRVLPSLFPTSSVPVFDDTARRAVAIEQPPPADQSVVATTLSAIGALGTQNFFAPTAKRRLVVVLTDGESTAFEAPAVARALAAPPGAKLVLVHVWKQGEAVYDGGRAESGYRANAASADLLASLASAAGGAVFGEHATGAAGGLMKADVGTGPTIPSGEGLRIRPLAPYVVLTALVPLLLALLSGRTSSAWRSLRFVRAARERRRSVALRPGA